MDTCIEYIISEDSYSHIWMQVETQILCEDMENWPFPHRESNPGRLRERQES